MLYDWYNFGQEQVVPRENQIISTPPGTSMVLRFLTLHCDKNIHSLVTFTVLFVPARTKREKIVEWKAGQT